MTGEHAAAIAELRAALVAAHAELLRRYIHAPEPALAAENMDRVGVKIAAIDALLASARESKQDHNAALRHAWQAGHRHGKYGEGPSNFVAWHNQIAKEQHMEAGAPRHSDEDLPAAPQRGGPRRPEYEPKTAEQKLGYLIEECGEVLAAAGKTVRWGLDSYNPELNMEDRETNRDWLLRELADLKAAIERVEPVLRAASDKDGNKP